MVPTRLVVVSVIAIAALSVGCKKEVKERKARWQSYTQEVVEANVAATAFEKLDAALARGDRAALAPMFMPKVYELGVSTLELKHHTGAEVIDVQLSVFERCGLIGKTERVFDPTGVLAAVGLKNATFEELGEKQGVNPERVLPEDGVWFIARVRDDVQALLDKCGITRGVYGVVLAPTAAKDWRVVGWTWID